MKKFSTLLLSSLLLLASCNKNNDDDHIDPDQAVSDIGTYIVVGDWEISSYKEADLDKTADYSAYTFTFNEDGVVSAFSTPEMLTGAWRLLISDDPDLHVHFDLLFGVADTHPFDGLNGDWDLVSYTDTKLSLKDANSSGTERDILVFTKR